VSSACGQGAGNFAFHLLRMSTEKHIEKLACVVPRTQHYPSKREWWGGGWCGGGEFVNHMYVYRLRERFPPYMNQMCSGCEEVQVDHGATH